jgi:hypothetical protein
MNLNIIFIFLIIIIIGYFFVQIILNIIDKKLNNIQLNVNIPIEKFINKEEINMEYEKDKNMEEQNKEKKYSLKKNKKETNFDNDYYSRMNCDSMIEGYSNHKNNKSFKGWDVEEKEVQTCIKNHSHQKNGKDINCNYGLTNYADPKDMSPMDYKIFILNYPSNMTLQDYINWLYCFLDNESQLPYNHLKNLEKLKFGKKLIEEEGILPPPSYYYPPLNAKDYFEKMYNEINEFNIAPPLNSNTGPMLGYNYNDYSEFTQNMDLYGSTGTIRNKDIKLKKNAKKLYNYINPKDSNSLNIDNENEIYRIKNVEI